MSIPTMEEMLKAGLHFGHQASRWHPKMEPYIYTTRNGLHIVDLKKTQSMLEQACEFAKKIVADGGDILFVGTKTQAQPLIEKYAAECGMPYIKSRWIGGLITNFKEVKKNIKRYLDLKKQSEAGEWKKYTKKEQIGLKKEMEKLQSIVSGLVTLDKFPKALFVVDIKYEKTAVLEANVKNIPIIAITDTNTNPEMVQYPIPGNDDATGGIEMVVQCIAQACSEGKKKRKVMPAGAKAKSKPGVIKKVVKAVTKSK
jgi:small subunit ribosomal protein S2